MVAFKHLSMQINSDCAGDSSSESFGFTAIVSLFSMMFDGRTRDEQIEVFEQLFKNSYDYKEALDRRNLKLSDIEELREKLADCEHVPKVLIDNQVDWRLSCGNKKFDGHFVFCS